METYYSNRDLGDEDDGIKTRVVRQAVLPADAFAHEAVQQYLREHKHTDPILAETLTRSAHVLAHERLHERQRDNVREFLTRITKFTGELRNG